MLRSLGPSTLTIFLASGPEMCGVFCMGEKYYVIYADTFAYVGLIENITDIRSSTILIPGKVPYYKHEINIYENYKSFQIFAIDSESKDNIIYAIKDVLKRIEPEEETLDGLL